MTRILDWAFSCHTPFIYGVVAAILLTGMSIFFAFLTAASFVAGMWYIPIIMWIVLPAWFLIYQYRKDGGG